MATLSTDNESPTSLKKLSPDKRWGKEIPEQFIKGQDTQTNKCTREDTVYRYYADTDTLSVYFAVASPGVVDYCEKANKDILVSYDNDDKIVSVDIYRASKLLCCHLLDDQGEWDNMPPLLLYPIYYKDRDELEVYLVDPPSSATFQKTEDEDFEVGIDNAGKIVVLLFHNTSSRIAKTLSERERKKLEEELKLRSKEIAKWSHLLD